MSERTLVLYGYMKLSFPVADVMSAAVRLYSRNDPKCCCTGACIKGCAVMHQHNAEIDPSAELGTVRCFYSPGLSERVLITVSLIFSLLNT